MNDRFGLILSTVAISVLLTLVAVVSGAAHMLQELFGTAPAASAAADVPETSTAPGLRADLVALQQRLGDFEQALASRSTGDGTVVVADTGELDHRVSVLNQETIALRNEVAALRAQIASLSMGGGAASAGDFNFDSEVERALHDIRAREAEEARLAQRDNRLAQIDRQKERADNRVPTIVGRLGDRHSWSDTQQEMVQEALLAYTYDWAEIGFQSWDEQWADEKKEQALASAWDEIADSLYASGIQNNVIEQLKKVSTAPGSFIGAAGNRVGGDGGGGGRR